MKLANVDTSVVTATGTRFLFSFINMNQRAFRKAAFVVVDSVLQECPDVLDNGIEYLMNLKRTVKEITACEDYKEELEKGCLKAFPEVE